MKACGGLFTMVTAIAGSCRDGWQELPAAWHGRTERDDAGRPEPLAHALAPVQRRKAQKNELRQLCA